MTINEHATSFAGKPVVDWEPGVELGDISAIVPRVSLSYDAADGGETWAERFATFLELPGVEQLTGLVVGTWDTSGASEDGSAEVVATLVAAHDRLPGLRAIFLGDIIMEEAEISWIQQSDLSPLLAAFPGLEHFRVRGGNGLSLGRLKLERLVSLVLESGGLPSEVVRQVAAAELPALEHLELWLGTQEYGRDGEVDDLAPMLGGERFPRLAYLGLRDSDQSDQIAAAVVRSPLTERIKVLDLSLGTLTDSGAAALLSGDAIRRLERLDIHHHYCTPAVVEQLEGLGIELDASDPQEAYEYQGELSYYVAVGE